MNTTQPNTKWSEYTQYTQMEAICTNRHDRHKWAIIDTKDTLRHKMVRMDTNEHKRHKWT